LFNAERLVEQEDCRLEHEGAGQGDPLPLASGDLARHPLAEDLGPKPHHLERPPHPLRDLGLGRLALLQAEGDVALDGEMGKERVILEHHGDLALVGPLLVDGLPQQLHLAAILVWLFEAG
jgi:hypothetical protein